MSFLGKIKQIFSKTNRMNVGGFSVGGAKIVDQMPPKTEPTEAEIIKEQDKKRAEDYAKKVMGTIGFGDGGANNSDGSGGGGSDKKDFLARRFNYERHATFPWLPERGREQYKKLDLNLFLTPWGRILSGHVIDRMIERKITAQYVEKIIAYGYKETYANSNGDGHNRVYQGYLVGVTKDEKIVKTTLKSRKHKQ